MAEPIFFTLDMVPVAKGRPRFARRGNFVMAYTPIKTREADKAVLFLSARYRPKQPIDEPIRLTLRFYMPITSGICKADRLLAEQELFPHTKKPDIDNLIKQVCDPLNGIFWTDDSRICSIDAKKIYSLRPRIEVNIIPYQ